MDAMTCFVTCDVATRSLKSSNKGIFESMPDSYPIASGILTLCRTKTLVIAAKKNKISTSDDNRVVLRISKNEFPKIAYIAINKIKKCLTFDYRCVRNRLQLNEENKWRYLWPF